MKHKKNWHDEHTDSLEFGQRLAKNGRATVFTDEEIHKFKTDKKAFLEFRKSIVNGTIGE